MSQAPAPTRVLVAGSVGGALREFFSKIDKLNSKSGPFDFLLITGDVFAPTSSDPDLDLQLQDLLAGNIPVPIMTYFIPTTAPLPPAVAERLRTNPSGEVRDNLICLANCGVLRTSQGVKIAYLGGAPADCRSQDSHEDSSYHNNNADQESPPADDTSGDQGKDDSNNADNAAAAASSGDYYCFADKDIAELTSMDSANMPDILVSYNWPSGVTRLSKVPLSSPNDAPPRSGLVANACQLLKPRYHFAASEGVYYEREPWDYGADVKIGGLHRHYTRFIGIGGFKNPTIKSKWLYAVNVVPLCFVAEGKMSEVPTPTGCTRCPLGDIDGSKKRQTAADSHEDDSNAQFFWGSNAKKPRSSRRAPPEGYVCRKCNVPGHYIQDCPESNDQEDSGSRQQQQQQHREPPEGYICRICKNPGHWVQQCPERSTNAVNNRNSSTRGAKKSPEEIMSSCWFCLANPNLDKQLIVAIGNETYLTMAKGGLVTDKPISNADYTSPVPGGGHVLIIPINHYTNQHRRPDTSTPETWDNFKAETARFKRALADCYSENNCVPVFFEVCRNANHQHTHIQAVPIPKDRKAEIREFFVSVANEEGIEHQDELPKGPSLSAGYFKMEFPDGGKPVYCPIPPHTYFNLQYGRHVLAKFLGMPAREDWRACTVPDAEEVNATQAFARAFKPYNFTLEDE